MKLFRRNRTLPYLAVHHFHKLVSVSARNNFTVCFLNITKYGGLNKSQTQNGKQGGISEAHIWFSETRTALSGEALNPYLGTYNGTAYLEQARFLGAKVAYDAYEKPGVVNKRAFNSLPASLDNVPYICLRLPTGGGKTLLAAQTVRIASESYLEREFPLALWLVPSNTIRSQTLETLKTPGN